MTHCNECNTELVPGKNVGKLVYKAGRRQCKRCYNRAYYAEWYGSVGREHLKTKRPTKTPRKPRVYEPDIEVTPSIPDQDMTRHIIEMAGDDRRARERIEHCRKIRAMIDALDGEMRSPIRVRVVRGDRRTSDILQPHLVLVSQR